VLPGRPLLTRNSVRGCGLTDETKAALKNAWAGDASKLEM